MPNSAATQRMSKEFFERATPYYFDGVKLVGTGNGTGLFGAGVALYYFSTRGPDVLGLIKWAAFIYLGGVCLFAVAFFSLTMFSIRQIWADQIEGESLLNAAVLCTMLSFAAWWAGTICVVVIFSRL
jgi:hypothetical protein